MLDWRGAGRVDRAWQSAVAASCLVHLCLVVSGWLLITSPHRLPKLRQVIRVSLAAPQAKQLARVAAEKTASPAIFRPPAVVAEPPAAKLKPLQPVVSPPVKSTSPAAEPQVQKKRLLAVKTPLREPVKQLRQKPPVKPARDIVILKQTALESKPVSSQRLHSQPSAVDPAVTTSSDSPAAAIPERIVAPEATGINEAETAAIRNHYLALLRQRIERYKKYPLLARKGHQQGVVVVEFELSSRGELQSCLLQKSCGKRLLDRAALQAVEAAAPFPDIPSQILSAETRFVVPVRFVLAR